MHTEHAIENIDLSSLSAQAGEGRVQLTPAVIEAMYELASALPADKDDKGRKFNIAGSASDHFYRLCTFTTDPLPHVTDETRAEFSRFQSTCLQGWVSLIEGVEGDSNPMLSEAKQALERIPPDLLARIKAQPVDDEAYHDFVSSMGKGAEHAAVSQQMGGTRFDPKLKPTFYISPGLLTEPGYHRLTGDVKRVYINCDPGVTIKLLEEFVEKGKLLTSTHFKSIDFSLSEEIVGGLAKRSDKLVCYTTDQELGEVLETLQTFQSEHAAAFERLSTPLFAIKIADGIALADSPEDDRISFNRARAKLLAALCTEVASVVLDNELSGGATDGTAYAAFVDSVKFESEEYLRKEDDYEAAMQEEIQEFLEDPAARRIALVRVLHRIIPQISKADFGSSVQECLGRVAREHHINPENLALNLVQTPDSEA